MPKSSLPPTCNNCEHSWKQHSGGGWVCSRALREWNPIDGYHQINRPCEFERTRIWRWFGMDTCGPEGRYWEAEKPRALPPRPHR